MALVLTQAALLALTGVVIGVAAALLLGRLITSMLFQVSPASPATLGTVVALLAAVAGLATVGAARRAGRIEASVALRQD